jgi:hypothetical protein
MTRQRSPVLALLRLPADSGMQSSALRNTGRRACQGARCVSSERLRRGNGAVSIPCRERKPEAQMALARMHREGKGTPKNDAQAVVWYRRAADQGHAERKPGSSAGNAGPSRVPPMTGRVAEYAQSHVAGKLAAVAASLRDEAVREVGPYLCRSRATGVRLPGTSHFRGRGGGAGPHRNVRQPSRSSTAG